MTSQSYLDVFFQVMDGDRDVLTTSLKKEKSRATTELKHLTASFCFCCELRQNVFFFFKEKEKDT